MPTAKTKTYKKRVIVEITPRLQEMIAICPGSVASDFFRGSPSELETGTMISLEDIAETILYATTLSPNSTVNEIEIRPANPKKA